MRNGEYMTKAGAVDLAIRIKGYWAGKGVAVSTEIIPEPDPTGKRENMYVVRSNLKVTAGR